MPESYLVPLLQPGHIIIFPKMIKLHFKPKYFLPQIFLFFGEFFILLFILLMITNLLLISRLILLLVNFYPCFFLLPILSSSFNISSSSFIFSTMMHLDGTVLFPFGLCFGRLSKANSF